MKVLRFAIFLIGTLGNFTPILAQGNLMVMPKRLIFDGKQRSHDLNLINVGQDTTTYSINFIEYKMTENGGFEKISSSEEGINFASDFLRYYPRKVTLGPKESQHIKVQLKRIGNLAEGEYRSHISFMPIVNQGALDNNARSGDELIINVQTFIGISIPVIIRKGENNSSVWISDVKIIEDKNNINLTLNRDGNMSVYGDLTVKHISSKEKVTKIGVIKGISVYTPNPKRALTLPLKNTENIDLNEGQLEIIYEDKEGKLLGSTIVDL